MSEKIPKNSEKPQEIERPEAEFEEIEKLYEPIKKILQQIRSRIENGEYQLIIGEDASGRIPTLIFDYVIRGVCQNKGFPLPETRFFAGSSLASDKTREKKSKEISQKISSLSNIGRVLVITDTIASGSGIKPITKALHSLGKPFDVAAVGLQGDLQELEKILEANIFYGIAQGTPRIYGRRDLAGVKKDSYDLYSKPYKVSPKDSFSKEPPNADEKLVDQNKINLTREGVKNIAQRLIADLGL